MRRGTRSRSSDAVGTTIGISGAAVEQIEDLATLVADFATGAEPSDGPSDSEVDWNHPMPLRLKFASDDLRAFYHEAATAQPGANYPTDADLNDWLFNRTLLGNGAAPDRWQNAAE